MRHRVSAPFNAHRLKRVTSPCEHPDSRALLRRASRAVVKLSERSRNKSATTLTGPQAMLTTCKGAVDGIPHRALLCFRLASGGRRRSEIAFADLRPIGKE